ncbi:MAG: hypothetical protein HY965_07140 [Ignavibacteriales bacterium]|nr:hypothetical protein [Ignavibacteriales bacterium]
MKKTALFIFVFCAFTGLHAQFRETNILKPSIKDGITNNDPNFIMGLFDPSRFSMSHSYSLSYSASGKNGLALGVYTNSMMFKFADNLNLVVDASMVHSPYSTFGKTMQNQLTGIYLSNAQLSYRPSENTYITLQYQNIPESYYYSNPFRRSFFGSDLFQEPQVSK